MAVGLAAWPLWQALGRGHAEVEAAAQRLGQVLDIAAHAHIELDEEGRVLASANRGELKVFGLSPPTPGRAIWELPQAGLAAEAQASLRQAILARKAWPELDLAWQDGRGGRRHLSLCGVPRFRRRRALPRPLGAAARPGRRGQRAGCAARYGDALSRVVPPHSVAAGAAP